MIDLKDRLLGGLYGVLIGDACGLPYEFKKPHQLPPYEQIEMIPPEGYARSWKNYQTCTWTDDGSQALCLLEYYTEQQEGDVWHEKWAEKLLRWKDSNHYWVDGISFGAGMQTMEALTNISRGQDPMTAAPHDVMRNGNGSLMRCLPTALWNARTMTTSQIAQESENISHLTHPHIHSKMCCVFYNLVAQDMLTGSDINDAVEFACERMKSPAFGYDQGEWFVVWNGQNAELKGDFYVVNTLWTAEAFVRTSTSFEQAIKRSIHVGYDTDTTAAVAGGLAGIKFGYSGIPQHWIDQLKGKHLVEPLAQKLLERHGLV